MIAEANKPVFISLEKRTDISLRLYRSSVSLKNFLFTLQPSFNELYLNVPLDGSFFRCSSLINLFIRITEGKEIIMDNNENLMGYIFCTTRKKSNKQLMKETHRTTAPNGGSSSQLARNNRNTRHITSCTTLANGKITFDQ
ncbi:hypothetical protein AB6A40_004847 [Gnathostoma spinigerum]|uniref:Uncharacterized protein n=1 Tax=Gnathostoma spinigerum TaxID=75299 RepID=A0ABD6EDW0_9BILA